MLKLNSNTFSQGWMSRFNSGHVPQPYQPSYVQKESCSHSDITVSSDEEDTQCSSPSPDRDVQTYMAVTRKPHRKFTDESERQRFVEGYKMKFKTELCKNWITFGKCKFGDSCAFAHGEHQIQNKLHVPSNYKTKVCKQFHESGYCSYGLRCQFLHKHDQRPEQVMGYTEMLNENVH